MGDSRESSCLLPDGHCLMLTETLDTTAELAVALLIKYSFDLTGYSARELLCLWEAKYPVNWVHLAVIEALYQGRYKAVSVEQILAFWQRRGQVIYHFNSEFERLICRKFTLTTASTDPVVEVSQGEDLVVTEGEIEDSQPDSSEESAVETKHVLLPRSRVPVSQLSKFLEQQVTEAESHAQVDDASLSTNSYSPIMQFTPKPSGSEVFTSKLKGFVKEVEQDKS